MTSAQALLIASIATVTLLAAMPAAAIDPTPERGQESCGVEAKAPMRMWTACTKDGDFRASNLTLSGQAAIAGALYATDARVRTLEATQGLRAPQADVEDLVARAAIIDSVAAGTLRATGLVETPALRLTSGASTACAHGTLALGRNAAGADVLQACLRSAQGAAHWVTVATG